MVNFMLCEFCLNQKKKKTIKKGEKKRLETSSLPEVTEAQKQVTKLAVSTEYNGISTG